MLLGTGQNLLIGLDELSNDLHDGRCLARPGRSVDDGDVFGCQGELHRRLLRSVQGGVHFNVQGSALARRTLAHKHLA